MLDRDVVVGLGWLALVGGGFRCALVAWALRRGEATPPSRARVSVWVFGAVAAIGAMLLVYAYVSGA